MGFLRAARKTHARGQAEDLLLALRPKYRTRFTLTCSDPTARRANPKVHQKFGTNGLDHHEDATTRTTTRSHSHSDSTPLDVTPTMHLMYTIDASGKRVYTLKKTTPGGEMTKSAHPGVCVCAKVSVGDANELYADLAWQLHKTHSTNA